MDAQLIEKCAEALWKEYIKDPANRHHINKLFKHPNNVTWKDANDPDIIPMFADKFRQRAKRMLKEAGKHIFRNTTSLSDDRALAEIYSMLNEE